MINLCSFHVGHKSHWQDEPLTKADGVQERGMVRIVRQIVTESHLYADTCADDTCESFNRLQCSQRSF